MDYSHKEIVDVKKAFLFGDINEEICMEQPPGFVESNNKKHVCKLLMNISGLKEAA